MKLMKEMILEKGKFIDERTLKVDSFLNHQIDPKLMMEMGRELKKRFENKEVTKILTIEASGIAIALAASVAFDVPMVFAKKKKPSTMGNMYSTSVYSFTKKIEYDICISKEFINEGDKILVVDDFLAMGNALIGLERIIKEAKAEMVGVGIAIEKGFQDGGKIIRERGIHLESMAILNEIKGGEITFA